MAAAWLIWVSGLMTCVWRPGAREHVKRPLQTWPPTSISTNDVRLRSHIRMFLSIRWLACDSLRTVAAQAHPRLQPRGPRRAPAVPCLHPPREHLHARVLLFNVREQPFLQGHLAHVYISDFPRRACPFASSWLPLQPASSEASVSSRSSAQSVSTYRITVQCHQEYTPAEECLGEQNEYGQGSGRDNGLYYAGKIRGSGTCCNVSFKCCAGC